jgi:Protein of unknown function (DUF2975)
MTNTSDDRRLLRWARLIRALCVVGALILLVLPTMIVLDPNAVFLDTMREQVGVHWRIDTAAQRSRGWLVSLLPTVVGSYALWQLWQLCGRYARGDVFGVATVRMLGRFARGLLAFAVCGIVTRTLMSLALTWDFPPGQRVLMIGLGSNDYLPLLFGVVLVAITQVMQQAARIAEDNAAII